MKYEQCKDWNAVNGTSLRGYVTTTYDRLVEVFGEPTRHDGDKVNVEWILRFEDGTVATIYDWKEDYTPRGVYEWHIGGHPNSDAVPHVQTALQK